MFLCQKLTEKHVFLHSKKNVYALKTPHVVFLPVICLSFFFGRSIDKLQGSQKSMERPIELFWPCDVDLWPMTLTYLLDVDILPLDLHAKIQVCMSVRSPRRVRRMHTHTYGLRRLITHTDVCSLCATCNHMRALYPLLIFHQYEKHLWT